MGKKKAIGIMNSTEQEPQKVIDVGVKVDLGLYENIDLYAEPKVEKLAYRAQLLKAQTAQGKVANGSVEDTAERDYEVGLFFVMLNDKNLPYVNGLYKGDRVKLLASGFDVFDETTPHPIPAAPIIGRVVSGKEAHSVKIYLSPASGLINGKAERLNHDVWVKKVKEEGAIYHNLLSTTNRRDLVLKNLTRGDDLDIYLTARNAAGTSAESAHMPFLVN